MMINTRLRSQLAAQRKYSARPTNTGTSRARTCTVCPAQMEPVGSVTSLAACRNRPIRRQWARLVHGGPQPDTQQAKLRVLQWNLLADGLAQWGDFIRVRPEVLEWAYRKPLILQEVLQSRADVLCFQELNHYGEMAAELMPHGYTGVFLAKRQSPATKYQCPADGVAIFWKQEKFKLVEKTSFHFKDRHGAPGTQGCVSVLLMTQSTDGSQASQQVLVATTHLKAKEGAELDTVRVLQMQQVLSNIAATLDNTLDKHRSSPDRPSSDNGSTPHTEQTQIPVVIAGDLNTTPSSSACQLLSAAPWSFQSIWDSPSLASDQGQEEHCAGNGTMPAAGEATQPQEHPAETSAAEQGGSPGPSSSPEFSTWKFRSGGESKRIIDHIYFTGLVPQQRWRMLSEDEIGCDGLPCDRYPSDHIALCCEFGIPHDTH